MKNNNNLFNTSSHLSHIKADEFKNMLNQMTLSDFFDLKTELQDTTCQTQSFFSLCVHEPNTYYFLETLLLEHIKKEKKKSFLSYFSKPSSLDTILETILSGDVIHYKLKDELTLAQYLINYEQTLNLYHIDNPVPQSLLITFMLSYMDKKEQFAYDFYDIYQNLILKEVDKFATTLKPEFEFFNTQFKAIESTNIEKTKNDYQYLMKKYLSEQSYDYSYLPISEHPKRAIWFYPMYKMIDYFIAYEAQHPQEQPSIAQVISYSQGFLDLHYTNRDVFLDYEKLHEYDCYQNKMKCTIDAKKYMQLSSSQTKHIFECLILRSFESFYYQYAIENEKDLLDSIIVPKTNQKRMKI